MKKTILICSLLLVFLLGLTFSSFAMETEKWKEDLNYLENRLPKLHKDLFHKLSEDKFHNLMVDLKSDLGSLNDFEINLRLAEIFTKIGDSHTGFNYNKYISEYYPVSISKFGDNYYVTRVDKEFKEVLGGRLININGYELNEIREKLSKIIPAENQTAIKYKVSNYLNLPEVLSYCGLIDENNKFTFETDDGKISVSLPPRKITNMQNYRQNSVVLKYKPGFIYKHPNKIFWHQYLPKEKVLYFQYDSCYGREVAKEYYDIDNPKLPSFKNATNEMINIIKNKEVDKFIVDLRANSGGSSPQGTKFAEKIKSLNPSFKTYVIIGNKTFSSAIINAIDFKKKLNATLIGEPTTGKPNHYGEVRNFDLPNSKLKIHYSTKYFTFIKNDPDSLYPDQEVYTTFEDFVQGKDTILQEIFSK